ncbi:GLUG motif-containing protein [Thalassolituus oleivorans]|uniref:GLUG motif-containing protein n=1 Tax=Thalassolituus oleivorans TaxID=187493 RepID=UPI001CE28D5A|nr:GLUG motif-containing protein [Thalassolituus oleivorans]MCA6128122.1 hypothetical protein [Thalassolituus oleivorans 4BN06-13]
MAITPFRLLMPMILGCLIVPSAFAESGRVDYDLDDDGLIEINSLADLNEIRNNLDGTSLYGDSTGCPVDGCIGFELTTTLDFDTNADGVMDTNDGYWNGGDGWMPIGSSSTPFSTTFDGNGHQIRNLYINRNNANYIGLFGAISGESAQLRNVGLTGELMQVQGYNYVGGLVGYANSAARIEQSYVTGAVTGDWYVGGLAGYFYSSVINNSYVTGAVTGDYFVGGLVGHISDSAINSSFATGAVTGNSYMGGLVGANSTSITNSYWSVDTTGIRSASVSAATLAELQCPVSADNTSCVTDKTLYAEWDSGVWDFGTNVQLPGLILSGTTYRDSDSDGLLDEDDAFPNSRAASYDSDSDGHPDVWNSFCDRDCIVGSGLTLDRFPNNSAAWLDGDLDGFPDSWADSCDVNCQAASGLTLDSYPNDIDEDGINDDEDTDDNGDGIIDADSDSDGLIDVTSLEQLNAIRYNLAGSGRTLTDGGEADSSGCPPVIIDGALQFHCSGYELTSNLDFDTNADGVMDASDAYWNDGAGWMPIGSSSAPFTTTFDGNGHQIRNLYINRSHTDYIGLFGAISGESAQLHNVGLTGKLMKVQGYRYVGGFVGYADNAARIEQSYVTGAVTGYFLVGGFAGYLDGSAINNSFVTGAVTGDSGVGGLAGYLDKSSAINNSYVTGAVIGSSSVGGLTGYNNGSVITDSYWAVDTTGIISTSALAATQAELQCPVGADNKSCVLDQTLYAGWDSGLWDFGTNAQLPGLILSGTTYRDSDGDGSLDGDDAFPNNHAASWDGDNDGHPDMWTIGCDASCISNSGLTLDQFPSNPAVWQDEDLDGYPESWVDGCDANCQTSSGLTLDSYLDDTDNDGINNSDDTDDNNDGITDADADSDGLIEVSTLEQLNAIRYNLMGTGRTLIEGEETDSSGCPVVVLDGVLQLHCSGYELTNNLDFDTNADGVIDANDAYWNEGYGWEPIGTDYDTRFTSMFDGNGYQIRNLYIDRSSTDYVGLFGFISGKSAQLRNVGLTGELMQVLGDYFVGGLAGYARSSARIEQSYVTGVVTGYRYVGGVAGYLYISVINNSYVTGAVTGYNSVGGLVGSIISGSTINSSFATGAVTGNSSVGGLSGYSSSSVITNSYWAVDTTGIRSTSLSAATLAELQCPAGADNTSCVADQTLYAEWDSGVWDFGSNTQLPGLILSGTTYRDSDGDGSLDEDDAFPNNRAASYDSDSDGHPDVWNSFCDRECIADSGLALDQFPNSAAAWQDGDLDGFPDSWADSCDVNCQAASGLTLDSYPNDIDEDGINDDEDTDDNNDGVTDSDADSDGLIDVTSIEQLNAIRYNLAGTGRTLVDGGDIDSSGCPVAVVNGVHQFQCMGYELINNLDFDTNADGVMDANDAYWNEGEGWMPISSSSTPFTSTFDGNGHQIRNLYINRSSTNYVGLFGYILGESAQLRNIGLTGELMQVLGDDYVGGLVGYAKSAARIDQSYVTGAVSGSSSVGGLAGMSYSNSAINNSFASGAVTGDSSVGGLVGYFSSSTINSSFATGAVTGNSSVGGLVGTLSSSDISTNFASGAVTGNSSVGGLVGYSSSSTINSSFATGAVIGDSYVGGLTGYSNSTVTNSHWATDTTGQLDSALESEFDNYLGATLAELQCPTSSDNTDDCVISNTLYAGWDSSVWDFGTSTQLPGLIINGIVYRDEDGNGSLDENQAPTVTLTLKQDGYVVSDITAGDGDVTLEATVTDPDASDRHTLSWTYEGITVTSETDTGVTFKSDNLVAGEYTVSVVATDNRYSPLSAEAEITFTVYSAYVPEPAPAPGNTSTSSGKKGGGGALGLIWLMLCGGLVYTRQRRVVFAG